MSHDSPKSKLQPGEAALNAFPFAGSGTYRMNHWFNHYLYWDSPAGKDLGLKLITTAPYASACGVIWGMHDVALFSKPPTIAGCIGRMIRYQNLFIGVPTAYIAGAFIAANVRDKDDEWTHFFGGVTAGTFWGAWTRSVFHGFNISAALGLFAFTVKNFEMTGIKFVREPTNFGFRNHRVSQFDWSLRKDAGEKGWTTDPNDTELDRPIYNFLP